MYRIGLLYPVEDPISAANWSGTPRGLHDGFTANGAEVVPVGCELRLPARAVVALLGRGRPGGSVERHRAPVYAAARSRVLARRLRALQPLDALVAMDTELYELPAVLGTLDLPTVTYDDGTFAQFARHPESEVRRLGFDLSEVGMWAERQGRACRRATFACLSTSYAARSVTEDYAVPQDRVKVVGMGHRPRVVHGEERDWSAPRFLFVGIDWGRKNGEAVLRAFEEVRRRHPDARLDVVGEHPPLSSPGVIGHGLLRREDAAAQRTLDGLYAAATAFVLPSRFDPSPIAYLEAASAGLPVVATTEGGAGELLGDAAITVRPDDAEALLAAMLQLADPQVAKKMGAEALHRSASSSWEGVTRRILQALSLA